MAMPLLLVKASAILAAALAAARLLRGGAACTRHGLWTATFVALLALPIAGSVSPALYVPVPGWRPAAPALRETPLPSAPGRDVAASAMTPLLVDAAARRDVRREAARMTWPSFATATVAAWLTGAVVALSVLVLSLLRVRRLAARSHAASAALWNETAGALGTRVGLRRPVRVLFSPEVRTPMAGGVWRPVIFLPATAAEWDAERREVVLAHELSHLVCRDPLRHLAARVAVACYWFHPLAWVAARHSSLAREQACDEAVLSLGFRPSDYARVLLELAETVAAPRTTAALPMVEHSLLEKRLMAILNQHSRPARRYPAITAVAAALLTLAIAAAQPAGEAATTIVTPTVRPFAARAIPAAAAQPASSAGPGAGRSQRASGGCWSDTYQGSFTGSSNVVTEGGRNVVTEMIGISNGDRIVQTHFGETRVCMVAQGAAALESSKPSQWAAPRIVIETQRGGSTEQMEIRGAQVTWRVNGSERAADAAAERWRAALMAALDTTWELATLRGQISTLRGEISTVRGEESTLRGEISTLQGEVSSMRGRQSSIRGEESSLRGEISSIQGHVSSLRGEISSQQGAISSLTAGRSELSSADRDRVRQHQARIAAIEKEIRDYDEAAKVADVERRIRALDADAKTAAVDDEIRRFNLDAKVAAVESRIQQLDVDGKVAEIERRIQALDADRRTRALEERRDQEATRLEQAIQSIK